MDEARVEKIAQCFYLIVAAERAASTNVVSPRWEFLRPEIQAAFRQAARVGMGVLSS